MTALARLDAQYSKPRYQTVFNRLRQFKTDIRDVAKLA